MPESCPQPDARARKTAVLLRNQIRRVGQNRIAEACGVDEATVSRMVQNVERWAILMTVCEMKAVPAVYRCVPPAQYDFMRQSTIDRLQHDEDATSALDWSDTP
ncbi:MAG TPA: hypothetical protein VGE96_00920 [Steroidobacteraceae bacterium]|jgi:hypothetical protein